MITTDLRHCRSILFLPASNPRAIEKARSLAADMIVLDLEDAVKPEDKAEARRAAAEAARVGFGGRPTAIRVNAAWLDSLPADLQELVRTSAKAVFEEQRATNRANAAAVLEELKGLGVEVTQLPAEELAKMESLTAPLFEEFGSKSAETAEMIAAIRALG